MLMESVHTDNQDSWQHNVYLRGTSSRSVAEKQTVRSSGRQDLQYQDPKWSHH